jgi:hypothetical protein
VPLEPGDVVAPPTCDAPAGEVFVDRDASPPGTGSEACPFTTITRALALGMGRPIRIEPGLYDEASGEAFPLDVQGAMLRGSPTSSTTIRGSGSVRNLYDATLIAAGTVIADVVLEPGDGSEKARAVACDEGDVTLDGVRIRSFDEGVVATGACRLTVLGSSIDGGRIGIRAEGRGPAKASIQIGDGSPEGANLFRGMHDVFLTGIGVGAFEHVDSVRVLGNLFTDADAGLHVEAGSVEASARTMEVRGNTFRGLSNFGALMSCTAAPAIVEANTFEGIVTPGAAGYLGVGLIIESAGVLRQCAAPAVPRARVRNNLVLGNDGGIVVRASTKVVDLDFGTPADRGDNDLRCNSKVAGLPGADLLVAVTNADNAPLAFAGNAWDHDLPTTAAGAGPDGVDILLALDPIPIDIGGARTSTMACPPGRVP